MANIIVGREDVDRFVLASDRQLSHIVAFGGGTGLPVVLMALRRHLPANCRITAVVTAADDGGSSGVLREEYGVFPPGDIRNCLLALARVSPEVAAALQYRFDGSLSTIHHPLGNLLLTALAKVLADDVAAIRVAANLLRVEDTVLPSTTQRVHLVADLADGRSIRGQSRIPTGGAPIVRLRLDPADAAPAPGVLEALRAADAVILGPGSLYTSTLAAVVVPGVVEAIAQARGARIFVCNLMTEPGETDGYDVEAHLAALAAHGLPADALDYVIVNTQPIPLELRDRYAAEGAQPVVPDVSRTGGRPLVVLADVLDAGPVVRHAPDKLGPILHELAAGHVQTREEIG